MSRGLALNRPEELAPRLRATPGARRRSSIALRARVLVARDRLDRELATGAAPSASAALALRARQLESVHLRRRLAAGLERSLAAAESRPRGRNAAAPVDVEQVLAARPWLLELASALRAEKAPSPAGVAIVRCLLTDSTSPIFRAAGATAGCAPDELRWQVRTALAAAGGEVFVIEPGTRPQG